MVRATVVAIALGLWAAQAHADDDAAQQLGRGFTAYDAGDLPAARVALDGLRADQLANPDYLYWVRGQVALLDGRAGEASRDFAALAAIKDSRFAREAAWRAADAAWEDGRRSEAAKAYAKLRGERDADERADLGVVAYRIAIAAGDRGALRSFLLEYPAHPLAAEVERALGGAVAFSDDERITRAQRLVSAHLWDTAVAELMLVDERAPKATRTRRDYWLGTTLFKMRRRYADAGKLLLAVAPAMGSAEALFHGARALSRADDDDAAIGWYRKVVTQHPKTEWAAEAQYLTGWLEFNRGRYRAAVAPLEQTLTRYPKSKWVDDSLWFLGLAHFLLGEYAGALPYLDKLAARSGSLEAGKGMYWQARTLERLDRVDEAIAIYQELVGRWPFAWYALLASARLREQGKPIGPFGLNPPAPRGPVVADAIDPAVAADPAIAAFDELASAGLPTDAGLDLARRERGFLARNPRSTALAVLFDRYGRGRNWTRPWKLALANDGGALDTPAEGTARMWWLHAYPEAYKDLVEQYQGLGAAPPYYLYAIMRKESGYDPHVVSYADAQGLLQMIPATTTRVAQQLKLAYAPGDLYAPELNIRTGSWYIGNLLGKFAHQIPIGAGSFNSGPRPVVKWVASNGARPIDEWVELVSYTQTREYMKKVTENYARYLYLYTGAIYEQPLTVDQRTRADDLTY